MPPERRRKVEAIVRSALDIESSADRERFVAQACQSDEEMRGEVEGLIDVSI